MKIGIFGGTFDPVHLAHLRAAEEFGESLELDHVLMVVSAFPPHREPPSASVSERLRMLNLAVLGNPLLEASDLEVRREGPSFTLETLRMVRSNYGGNIPYLALGIDAFLEISTWHRPADVLAEAHIVVLTRPGFKVDLASSLSPRYSVSYRAEGDTLVHASGATLREIQVTTMDISSSSIRNLVASGKSIRYLVPPPVFKYIQRKGLYESST